jgi:hypothetical protein
MIVVVACLAACGADPAKDKTKDPPKEMPAMNGNMRDIVANAIQHPGDAAALELDYVRGHDLSGMTRFHVDGAGAYTLSSSVTRDEQEHSWSGTLDAADRDALLRAIRDTKLLDVKSSTRNLADDEEPITVTLRHEQVVHEVEVWHDDAGPSGFAGFEAHVVGLVKKLSGGQILTIPAQ